MMIQKNSMTCLICKPNCCSNCFIFNNWVEEFEQHFIFFSNYYQLIIIEQKYIIIYQKLFKNYEAPLLDGILIIIFIICSIIFDNFYLYNYNIIYILILIILYIFIFYKNKYYFTEELNIYISPFNFVLIIIILSSIFFMYISIQIQLICMGLTIMNIEIYKILKML